MWIYLRVYLNDQAVCLQLFQYIPQGGSVGLQGYCFTVKSQKNKQMLRMTGFMSTDNFSITFNRDLRLVVLAVVWHIT